MKKNFIDELRWRGMVHDVSSGTEEYVNQSSVVGYIGFDPTADSLHIGNLAQLMTLMHFQAFGHKPIIVLGGATGMIGDPSGKSSERVLFKEEKIYENTQRLQAQLKKFLLFEGENDAEMLNNYTWFKNIHFLDFIRDVGKHITVSYMMAKDSIQKRMDVGISFTEFSYQLVQGYDFYWLFKQKNCRLQMGGSDQWGNIVTGIELIRRKENKPSFGLTSPLITNENGKKFGKTEEGNIWLDPEKTSPYKFYQYWINCSDEEAVRFIKIFTLKQEEEINALIILHKTVPHERKLQKELAKDITIRVHSEKEYEVATKISMILFGNSTSEDLENLDDMTLLRLFAGIPQMRVERSLWEKCDSVINFFSELTRGFIFSSKNEAIRMIKGGAISINKKKIKNIDEKLSFKLLSDSYLLVQKGKKKYYLIRIN